MLNEQQIVQVKEIVNQILAQRDAEQEKMYADVCNEIKTDDSNFKLDMERLSNYIINLPEIPTFDFDKCKFELPDPSLPLWEDVMKANFLIVETKIKEFQQNIEKLQQFYDKFNGENALDASISTASTSESLNLDEGYFNP